ncbi:hypothetical protein MGSAQ_001277 [marine sediment metagenome]|uniref:Uncharacterized protein n=1 Tax=marine sediment metagenome TaxID=412755 RepID=A0A1B6NWW4_9ZZZZ
MSKILRSVLLSSSFCSCTLMNIKRLIVPKTPDWFSNVNACPDRLFEEVLSVLSFEFGV